MDYKSTLNLPQTDFPMKADLVTREPARLKHWDATGLYAAIQAYAEKAGTPIVYDASAYPYWFVDMDKDGKADTNDKGAIGYNAWLANGGRIQTTAPTETITVRRQ